MTKTSNSGKRLILEVLTVFVVFTFLASSSGSFIGNYNSSNVSNYKVGNNLFSQSSQLPYVSGSEAFNSQDSILLNFGASIYIYGYSTSGISEASPFVNGSYAVGIGANGYNDTGMAISTSNQNSYNPYSNSYYTIGGIGVSDFTSCSVFYKVNTPPIEPSTCLNLTFNVTTNSLVVFAGISGGAYYINLSGIPDMKISSILNEPGDDGLEFAYANLTSGEYTIKESISNGDFGSSTRSEIISAIVFQGGNKTNSANYPVLFEESGLPPGTSWSVIFNGTNDSSTTNNITFSAPNGTYSYTVGSVNGYTSTPSSGTVNVDGSSVIKTITFTSYNAPRYSVTFYETGLPAGMLWYINISDGQSYNSTSDIIEFSEPNGSYGYAIGDTGEYSAIPNHGTVKVNGQNVSTNVRFTGFIFDIYSQYVSYFLSNVSFSNIIGVYASLNGSLPILVTGFVDGKSINFGKEGQYWNATINTGSIGSSNAIRLVAYYSTGENISKNLTVQVIPVPYWLSNIISSGLIEISRSSSQEWNNTYNIAEIIKIDFSSIFNQEVSFPDFWSGNFSFIPSIEFGLSFNSSGNISLFGSFTEKSPVIDLGPASISIGGTVKIVGDIEINRNLAIQWVSADLDMKIFGSASVNIPILGDTFDVLGQNISIGLSATISINPSFAVDLFFVPSSNASMDIIPNIDIAIQKIVSSISLPLTVQVNGGVGLGSVSGGGTITFTMNLQNVKPFNKGGNVSGTLFIKYHTLWWSGTIYSIGPGSLYSWGNEKGSSLDPSGNLSYMSRYFNVTGYDSVTWQNYSINGTAIHDIYPQTTVSTVTYGNATYVFYTSDNVSLPVNKSLYIQGYKFADIDRTIMPIVMPYIHNGITLHPYASILSNGTILLLWSLVPENELGAKSVIDIGNIVLQGAYYHIETGKWSSVFNISSGSVVESYKASSYGTSLEVAVLSQHSITSSNQNITIYTLPNAQELYNIKESNVSEIDTFSLQGNSLGLIYLNGSVDLIITGSNHTLLPNEPGFTVVSNGYVSGNASYEYLLYHSDNLDRIIVVNSYNDLIVGNVTINTSSLQISVFYYQGSLFTTFSSSSYIFIYNISENETKLFSKEYVGLIYDFGVSSSGSSALEWSLVNYGNATVPLLDLNFTELGSFYNVTVYETGLPSGTAWYVNLTNGMDSGPIIRPSYTFLLSNGSYSYSVTAQNRTYEPTSFSGSFRVDDKSLSEPILFTLVKYAVEFTESGLQPGTSWAVTLNGTTESSTNNKITFTLPNGTYLFSIANISGYNTSKLSDSITIGGKNVTQSVTFSPIPSTTPPPKKTSPVVFSFAHPYVILGAIIALAVIRSIIFLWRRKK